METEPRRGRRAVRGLAWAGLVGLLAALGCATPDDGATAPAWTHSGIIGGVETEEWPAVGAYLIGGQNGLCTGTVVAPDLVLTAAHCVVLGNSADAFFFGPSIYGEGTTIAVEYAHEHPDYDANTKHHDLGILRLTEPVTVPPMAINVTDVDDGWDGTVLHAVGYGNADVYDGQTMGIKRETDLDFSAWDDYLIYHETEGHNTCSGDSGGPVFVQQGADWVVAGVASFVYPGFGLDDYCSGGGGDARVDANLEWLSEYLEGLPVGDDDAGDDDDGNFLEEDDGHGCKSSISGSAAGPAATALAALAALLWGRRR